MAQVALIFHLMALNYGQVGSIWLLYVHHFLFVDIKKLYFLLLASFIFLMLIIIKRLESAFDHSNQRCPTESRLQSVLGVLLPTCLAPVFEKVDNYTVYS